MMTRFQVARACIVTTLVFSSAASAAEETTIGSPRFDGITERMGEFVKDKQISGSVTLVVHDGKIVHLAAVGQADLSTSKPMTADSIFAIASMTKPITATALMILVDEGKVSIDDPVSKYLPEFKKASLKAKQPDREITIRDALTHTAGLGGSQKCEGSLKTTAQELAARTLLFEPGSKWSYSPGLNVCGRIIEVVSGKSFDDFLAERIFQPLKMDDTSFNPTSAQRARVVRLYKPGKDKKSLEETANWINDLSGPRVPNPSGGLFSTAVDMSRFYQMILSGGKLDGRRIVSKQAVEQMTTIQTSDLVTGFTPGNGWGLGWCVVREPQGVTKMLSPGTFGHGGAFGTQGWVDPQRKTIFVLMIQRTKFGNSDGADIRGTFQQLAVDALNE